MKTLILTTGLALLGSFVATDSARAYQGVGSNLGFVPFGFYQPYGIRYSTSVRTPPYFAVNPPVYYGSRYARPYGESPFASPPLLTAPPSYQAKLATEFVQPMKPPIGPQICNPYCGDLPAPAAEGEAEILLEATQGDMVLDEPVIIQIGPSLVAPIRSNPFVSDDEVVAALP